MASDHNSFANLIWPIADLLRGPYRPPQYERVMLPMTVLRRFGCVLAPTKDKVIAEHEKRGWPARLAGGGMNVTRSKLAKLRAVEVAEPVAIWRLDQHLARSAT